MNLKRLAVLAFTVGCLALAGVAQGPAGYTIFAGPILNFGGGFGGGAGLNFAINHNVTFSPTLLFGRAGHTGLFTLDGSFAYQFHPDDETIIPYILAGVGMSQFAGSTHGGVLGGIGAKFPIRHHMFIVPEIRAGNHGLARFTIGISKSF